MKETYIHKRFNPKHEALLEAIEDTLETYSAQGYDLTVRQLYYQLVAKNLIQNNINVYKQIVALVADARLAGRLDWGDIVDRARQTFANTHWDSPADILKSAAQSFRLDKWDRQRNYVELMVEKDALSGVVGPVCSDLDIPYAANKGYSSASAMYRAGKRLRERYDAGKHIHMIYLGDHDPSGLDMTRDIEERLSMFAGDSREAGGPSPLNVTVHRVALNMEQVKVLNPPENPAKDTDTRSVRYVEEFGESCWELDAVEPNAMRAIITEKVLSLRDEKLWDEAVAEEKGYKDDLEKIAVKFQKIADRKKKAAEKATKRKKS